MQITAQTIIIHTTQEDMNDAKISILINKYYHIHQDLLPYMHVYNLRGKMFLGINHVMKTMLCQCILRGKVSILYFVTIVDVRLGKDQDPVVILLVL